MRRALLLALTLACGCFGDDEAKPAGDTDSTTDERQLPPFGDASLTLAPDAGRDTGAAAPREFLEPGIFVEDDRVVFRTAEFTLPPGSEQYLCYPLTLDESIKVSRFVYAARPVVHHSVFVETLEPEPEGFSQCETLFKSTWLLAFAAGASDSELVIPSGAAREFAAGTQMMVQLHLLNVTSEEQTEQVEIVMERTRVTLSDPVLIASMGSIHIDLPPGQSTTVQGDCTLQNDVTVFAAFPHMHLLGTSMSFDAGDSPDTLEEIYRRDPWDFDMQTIDEVSFTLRAGQFTRVTCNYDNTREQRVRYGESSLEEMCFLVLFTSDNLPLCEPPGPDVPVSLLSGICGAHDVNDLGIGKLCSVGEDDCPDGTVCSADIQDPGTGQGLCITLGCESTDECGGGNAVCCTVTSTLVADICTPEPCRLPSCIPH